MNVILLILPVAVVLLVTALARPLLWLPAVLALLSSVAFERSAWPGTPEALPPSIEGLQPLPPPPAPEYDFSTTRDAVESLIKAAKQKDVEGFKRGISARLLEKTLAEAPDLAEPMRDWGKLSYDHQLSQIGDTAMVALINNVAKRTVALPMVRENGEWKLDLPKDDRIYRVPPAASPTPPAPPAPPVLTAEAVFRKMVAAANASDGGEFVKYEYAGLIQGALKHFLSNHRAANLTAKRGSGAEHVALVTETDTAPGLPLPAAPGPPPEETFDRAWAFTLIARALAALEAEHAERPGHFAALKPWLDGGGERPQAEVAEQLGLSVTAVKVAIHRLRVRFRELIRSEIAATVNDAAEAADELHHLIEIAARG